MKKIMLIATIGLVAWANTAYSQNEIDALRYSQSFFGGSARSMGMAGSFSALGADPTAINTNPAGLARFSKGHFSLTWGAGLYNYSSQYNGTAASMSRSATPIQGLALIFNAPRLNEYGWKSVQTSFTYNRLADFNATRYYEGTNYHSLLDVFASDGYLVPTSDLYSQRPFTTSLAWQTYAVDDDMNSFFETYYQPRLNVGDSMFHRKTIQSRGGISEYSFAISGNYNNSLYVGGSLNIQNIRYFENDRHQERVVDPDGFSLQSFTYDFNLDSRGVGANLKFGFIYLPTDEFRIGLAYHSPTMLRFKEKFDADMSAVHDFGTVDTPDEYKPYGDFQYRFRNPGRLLVSMAYIFEKRLAMNMDMELVDYGKAAFRSSNNFNYQYGFVNENLLINDLFRTTMNVRLGLEFAMNPEWFIRGGFALYSRAFSKDHKNVARANGFFAAGIGYRKGQFVFDLAYLNHRARSEYYAFDPDVAANQAIFRRNLHQVVLTLGLRFK